MLTCTNHCSQCGRHFHSLQAFDVHHVRDATGWPVCLDPVDLEDRDGKPRLVALGVGECRMYAENQTGVTIWALPKAASQLAWYAQNRLSEPPPDAQTASERENDPDHHPAR